MMSMSREIIFKFGMYIVYYFLNLISATQITLAVTTEGDGTNKLQILYSFFHSFIWLSSKLVTSE